MNQSFSTSMMLNNDIKIRNLTKNYGLCFKNKVIDQISFDISEREAFGLVGPNGSGKSTTFNILTAELAKTSGHLFLDGSLSFSIFSPTNTLFWKQNLGICFQNNFLYEDMTLEQHIDFYANLNGFRYFVNEDSENFDLGMSSQSIARRWTIDRTNQGNQRVKGGSIEMEEMRRNQNRNRESMDTIKETKSELDERSSLSHLDENENNSELDKSSNELLGNEIHHSSKNKKLHIILNL